MKTIRSVFIFGAGTGALLLATVPSLLAVNSLVSHRYLADPSTLVSKDSVYIYCSKDENLGVCGDRA